MRKLSFRWSEGFLIVYEDPEGLVVEGTNSSITFGPREIIVKGLYQGLREREENRGQNKVVYIDLAFPLKGRETGEGMVYQRAIDTYIGGYGISYTPLEGVGYYLTIYPPSGSLYDYAVVGEDLVMVSTLRRRQVYVMFDEERERRIARIILV